MLWDHVHGGADRRSSHVGQTRDQTAFDPAGHCREVRWRNTFPATAQTVTDLRTNEHCRPSTACR